MVGDVATKENETIKRANVIQKEFKDIAVQEKFILCSLTLV